MRKLAAAAVSLVCLAAFIVATGGRAEARIKCEGAYQVIEGSFHATPYCEDSYLAAVARTYGMNVSNVAVRNSPSVKASVCYTIGHDTRVSEICASYRRDGRHRR